MKTRFLIVITMIFSIIGLASILTSVTITHAQTHDLVPYEKDYVPYTENYNVRFDSDGNIDYDLLIAKIMPEIFVQKLRALGVNISNEDVVLSRGPRILMYQPQSYNCGYVIDQEKNKVYWLEAAINSTHIQYTNVYTEIPRAESFEMDFMDCFSPLELQVAELFLKEKSYFTAEEETVAAAAVKHELRGNDNLNKYQFKIGKFNFDYKNVILSFCGKFEGRKAGTSYFSGMIKKSGQVYLELESSMSPLCAIKENATLYDAKFKTPYSESLQSWKNLRLVDVHLEPTSVKKLLERNYLYVDFINYMTLGYASHLELERVDYKPENSSTVLRFIPSEKESYMKIRLPESTSSYYTAYGLEKWYDKKLLGVSILVDNVKTNYDQFRYVEFPYAPYPQYYTDLVFKIPANSKDVEVILDIENYDFDAKNSDGEWLDYVVRK